METLSALAETIQLAEQFHNVGMVCQTVQQCGGQAFVSKDLYPIGEFEVGGDTHCIAAGAS